MIIGLGTDIVNIERIAKTLQKFDEHFLTRIFTAEELEAIAACGDGGNKKGAIWPVSGPSGGNTPQRQSD